MSLALVKTRAIFALEAPLVTVEVHITGGLPAFNLVGLPEAAVKESRDRVRSAIINSQFEFPSRRITVNLAPADLPKNGGRFDLAIALGILAASDQIAKEPLEAYEFLGELALTGQLRAVRGIISATQACIKQGHILIVPEGNSAEAALASGNQSLAANHLIDICSHLSAQQRLPESQSDFILDNTYPLDMADIKGQEQARHVLEVAAAGGHNLLYEGPPGCGKSMLAQRLPSILPTLEMPEILDLLAVQSVLKPLQSPIKVCRPFRGPHHSATMPALIGGGNPPQPGEISLAHNGVLFLDELPEFQRSVLEALREPLENKTVCIARAARQATFPANFQLIAAMNPCPCGYAGSQAELCHCSIEQIQRYRQKISGPFLDRIDLHLVLKPTAINLLTEKSVNGESSATIQKRVQKARNRQIQRQGKCNAALDHHLLNQVVNLDNAARLLLQNIAEKMQLSARAVQRTLRVARTLADLKQAENVSSAEISEACSYRQLRLKL